MASQELQVLLEMLKNRPIPETEPTIEEMRAGFEQMAAAFPLASDVTTEPVSAGGVPAEWVSAPGADPSRAVLYLHGGGYIIGSIATHREVASRISRASGARVLVLDYRLGPECPFPAAVDDALAAYRWLLEQGLEPAKMVVAGDSAGGGLTVAALLAIREAALPLPAAGVCMSPWVDLECNGESMTLLADVDVMVNREVLFGMRDAYLAGQDARNPLASPLHGDLRGLPPLLIQVGTAETLYDDSTRLAERARAAGVEVTFEPWEDMPHIFQLFASILPEAREAIEHIGKFIREKTGAKAAATA